METTTEYRRIIDLHCDTVTRCYRKGLDFDDAALHFNVNRIPEGLRVCQAAAVFIPDEYRGKAAQDYFLASYGLYERELLRNEGRISSLRDLRRIERRMEEAPAVLFLTVEGGAALGGELEWVGRLWEYGVRMMTLTWNGANELCGGAASGEGFTAFGRSVVAEMERLGMAVDVSHLSDEGFRQLCEFAKAPFCASHSNSRTVCPHRRNLTDEMFREIAARGGVVGLNYSVGFIKEGGRTASVDDLLRHVHHFLELGGEDVIALGSDFDGTDLPEYLEGIWDMESFITALERSGIPGAAVDKILFDNANRYLSGLQKEWKP